LQSGNFKSRSATFSFDRYGDAYNKIENAVKSFNDIPEFIDYLTMIYHFLTHGNDERSAGYKVSCDFEDEFEDDVDAEDE
jgi:hypothetical protein